MRFLEFGFVVSFRIYTASKAIFRPNYDIFDSPVKNKGEMGAVSL